MTWNYRVMEFIDPHGERYQEIREVYYDAKGKPNGYIECAANVMSVEDIAGLAWVLDRMREALTKPKLRETDFEKQAEAEAAGVGGQLGGSKPDATETSRSRTPVQTLKGMLPKSDKPVTIAQMNSTKSIKSKRNAGSLKGSLRMGDDFDAPLPDDLIDMFEGAKNEGKS